MNILAVRLSSIGDIVHALPAVAALGQSVPQARIDWAVESRYAELLQDNPFVSRVVPLDTLGWRRSWTSPRTWPDVKQSVKQIRSLRPDIAIDFQGLVKSAAVARLSRAPRRIGFGGRWLREAMAGRLYTEQVSAPESGHVVEENFALVERLGARPMGRNSWSFPLPRSLKAEDEVAKRLRILGVAEFIVVNPGGGWASKRWPPEQYAALIHALGKRGDCHVVLTGSPAEEGLIRFIVKQAESRLALYCPSTLMEFVALVRRARLFVGGDTGPLHLAAGVGTPIVAIYGPTNPKRNGPFAPNDITLWNRDLAGQNRGYAHWGGSRGSNRTWLEGIATEQVLAAISKRLASGHGA